MLRSPDSTDLGEAGRFSLIVARSVRVDQEDVVFCHSLESVIESNYRKSFHMTEDLICKFF